MVEQSDRRVFAPTPQLVTLVIGEREVEAALYNFLDLPTKDALAVYGLEDELRAAEGWPAQVEVMRKIARLLLPRLDSEHHDALSPRQLQEVIAASHGVDNPPVPAEAAASSPSAGSTTP